MQKFCFEALDNCGILGIERELKMSASKRTRDHFSKPGTRNSELARAKRILRKHLPELRERYSIKSLGVFGSYVRGEQKKRSDLDVLIEFEQTPTLLEFVHLKRHLSQLVGIPVDLVLKKTLKPHIGRYILAEVVTVG